ncbi:MAG TPA: hypothetical protein DCQ28_11550 [Bacteroidetes bacterium]|nr:hypothetical protein [Bacteroidota bacterium]
MNYYALLYDVVNDYVVRRAEFRDEHLRLANEANKRGELLLGGAFTDPADRTLLVFHVNDKSSIEEFVKHDPYVINGLVKRWEIRHWNVVIGSAQQ